MVVVVESAELAKEGLWAPRKSRKTDLLLWRAGETGDTADRGLIKGENSPRAGGKLLVLGVMESLFLTFCQACPILLRLLAEESASWLGLSHSTAVESGGGGGRLAGVASWWAESTSSSSGEPRGCSTSVEQTDQDEATELLRGAAGTSDMIVVR